MIIPATDPVLFIALELLLVFFCLWASYQQRKERRARNLPGFSASIKRGDVAMSKFYGAYGVTSGVLVGVAFYADQAAGHRTLFIILNAAIPAYLCLGNGWSRNKLLGWLAWLQTREEN